MGLYADLDRAHRLGSVDMLLKQSVEQTATRPIEGKFVGDVIVTQTHSAAYRVPLRLIDCGHSSDTSIYKDKVGELVAVPNSPSTADPLRRNSRRLLVTSDGAAAQNSTLIERGVQRPTPRHLWV